MTDATYPVLDGGLIPAIKEFPSKLVGGVDTPVQVIQAMNGAVPTDVAVDSLGNLAVNQVLPPSGRTPLIDTFTATGRSATFTPIAGRPFNITLTGAAAFGAVDLERSFDSGSTWVGLTGAGYPLYAWTGPASESWTESEVGVIYSLNCTTHTTDIGYRISQ